MTKTNSPEWPFGSYSRSRPGSGWLMQPLLIRSVGNNYILAESEAQGMIIKFRVRVRGKVMVRLRDRIRFRVNI